MTSLAHPQHIFENLESDRRSSIYWDAFLEEYLHSDGLKDNYSAFPSLDHVSAKIDERKGFDPKHREELYEVLNEQYLASGIDLQNSVVANSIDSLRKENTFTITTGQQIHVGLGPLYVLYKILNVLQLSQEMEAANPGYRVVPVFWMATEDHDLEEIESIRLYNKDYTWVTDQKGPVGRMNTDGISDLFQSIENEVRADDITKEFLNKCKEAYKQKNLANASRLLLHEYFGDQGLVILDADHPRLKALFKDTMCQELGGHLKSAYSSAGKRIEDQGLKLQIHIRDNNLFFLGENSRHLIELKDQNIVCNGEVLGSLDNISAFVDKYHPNISPNVATRPLYQETILPNITYVGGPAEVKYWMQLKDAFERLNLPMPLLYLRTSAVLIPNKNWSKLSPQNTELFYQEEDDIVLIVNEIAKEHKEKMFKELDHVDSYLASFESLFNEYFKGFSISPKISKLQPKIEELRGISSQRFIHANEQDPLLKYYLKMKRNYFSTRNIQERTNQIAEHAYLLESGISIKKSFGFSNLLKINHLINKIV